MKNLADSEPVTEAASVDFSRGVRGKYSNVFAKGTNVVILDPALLPEFPDSQSVNDALHAFLSMPASQREAALARHRDRPEAFTVAPDAFDPRTGRNHKSAA